MIQTKTNLNESEPLFDLSVRSEGISSESLFPDKLLQDSTYQMAYFISTDKYQILKSQ